MRFFYLLAMVFLASSAYAQEGQKGGGRKALLPDISLIGSVAGAWFRDEPIGDQGENPARTGFNLQGAELALQSVIDPYVRGDLFFLFKEDGVELEEGTLTTLALPWNLQVKGGKLLAKLGRQNAQHLEQFNFVDSSFTHRYFLGVEGFHELGAELSVLLPTAWFSEFSFQLLQGENGGNFDGTRKGDFAYLGHWKNGFDLSPNLAGQLGFSGVYGFNSTGVGHATQIYGTDLYLRWKPSERRGLRWQTEYLLRNKEDLIDRLVEGGGYSQLIYQFARRWEIGIRGERIGLPADGFKQWALSPDLTFVATEFFRLRAQYNQVHTDGNPNLQHEAFLQIQFNMGPHGAHSF